MRTCESSNVFNLANANAPPPIILNLVFRVSLSFSFFFFISELPRRNVRRRRRGGDARNGRYIRLTTEAHVFDTIRNTYRINSRGGRGVGWERDPPGARSRFALSARAVTYDHRGFGAN